MTYNLDNALRAVQDARTAIMLETNNPVNRKEQEEALENMQTLLNEVEDMIKNHG